MNRIKFNSINLKTYFLSILLIIIPIAIILTISYKTFLGIYNEYDKTSSENHIYSMFKEINISTENYKSKIKNLSYSINTIISSHTKEEKTFSLGKFLDNYLYNNLMITDLYLFDNYDTLIYSKNTSIDYKSTYDKNIDSIFEKSNINEVEFYAIEENIFITTIFKSFSNDEYYKLSCIIPLGEIANFVYESDLFMDKDYMIIDSTTLKPIITSNNNELLTLDYSSYIKDINLNKKNTNLENIISFDEKSKTISAIQFKKINFIILSISNSSFLASIYENSGMSLIYSLIFCIILVLILITFYYYSNVTEYNAIIKYIDNFTTKSLFISRTPLPDPLIKPFSEISKSLYNTFRSLNIVNKDMENKSNNLSLVSKEMSKTATIISEFTDILSKELEKDQSKEDINEICDNLILQCETLKDHTEETNVLTQQLTSLIKENQNLLNK